jgi:hypothetical protein
MEKKKFLTDTQKDRATEYPAANLQEKIRKPLEAFHGYGNFCHNKEYKN